MNRLLLRVAAKRFSRLSQQEVQQSSYEELVEKMARTYVIVKTTQGNQEYKTRSALSLMEMHHLFGVFGEGQRVLDIGTGKGGWAALAIKHNKSTQRSPLVVCVDKYELPKIKGAEVVKGNFTQQETKVSIVEVLGRGNLFNTMFVNVEPMYTGITEVDAPKINLVITNAMDFGVRFMKAGGTLVCKTLLSSQTPEIEKAFRTYFNRVNIHKPSHSRSESIMRYYVLKGFMMTETAMLINTFREEFQKARNKEQVLKKFRKHRSQLFDPDQMLSVNVESNVYSMLEDGKTQEQVLAQFTDIGFVDVRQYIQKYNKMRRLRVGPASAKMEFMKREYGEGFRFPIDTPVTEQDRISLIEKIQKEIEEESQAEDQPDKQQELLKKDESYLKNTTAAQKDLQDYYELEDLQEELMEETGGFSHDDLEKMKKVVPGFDKLLKKMQNNTLTDQDLTNFDLGKFNPETNSKLFKKGKRINVQEFEDSLEREDKREEMEKDEYTIYKDLLLSRQKKERRKRGSAGRTKTARKRTDDEDFQSD